MVVLNPDGSNILSATDIQIGSVELKDSDSTALANIKAANTARTTATVVVATQPIDAAGNVLGRTAANTARTTGTLVDPVQVIDAAGNVFSVSAANTARTTGTMVIPVQQVSAAGAVDTLTTVTTVGTVTTITNTVPTSEVAPTTIYNGKKTVTTAGTRVTLASSQAVKSVTIKALVANTGVIYVGDGSVASTTGFALAPGDSISLDIANLATVNLDSSVNGEGVTYIGV